jgi:glyoxalase family protein
MMKLRGLHHITAIASDPQRNLDFYTQVLGLRLVKRTVNFDDPGSYHFYFGDGLGSPGTIITFFPWPGARRGTRGTGQVVATSFVVAPEAIDYWRKRLSAESVLVEETAPRFGQRVLRFADPDGLMLELVGAEGVRPKELHAQSDVPAEFALGGFGAPTLEMQTAKLTEQLLTRTFGFELTGEERDRRRFSLAPGSPAAQIDLIERSETGFGNIAAGTVHHIAFRAADDEEQLHWRTAVEELGFRVTPVIDRQYFHSIYFREPGGILFEIATDHPGFAIDEPAEHLGETLRLPPQYEEHRSSIEQMLPAISLAYPGQP